jgi:hypothetical protein
VCCNHQRRQQQQQQQQQQRGKKMSKTIDKTAFKLGVRVKRLEKTAEDLQKVSHNLRRKFNVSFENSQCLKLMSAASKFRCEIIAPTDCPVEFVKVVETEEENLFDIVIKMFDALIEANNK